MNAVIYARYSSDSQREESIEGQLRECREYAEFYSAELSEKIHRRQKENALKGKNNGGGVPLGYHSGKAIEQTFYALKLPFRECITWTTDGFFRETRDMVTYRKSEGCLTVEMECAALAACARKRGAVFGQILYTADSLANVCAHDERDWGKGSLRKALELCINALRYIQADSYGDECAFGVQ